MTPGEYLFSASAVCFLLFGYPKFISLGNVPVLLCWYFLTSFMKKKIGGYTGDCCGALTLLCELSFYMGIVLVYSVTH
jgi:cobalamin-5''-phosphate synthase (EC 2.7.8.26)